MSFRHSLNMNCFFVLLVSIWIPLHTNLSRGFSNHSGFGFCPSHGCTWWKKWPQQLLLFAILRFWWNGSASTASGIVKRLTLLDVHYLWHAYIKTQIIYSVELTLICHYMNFFDFKDLNHPTDGLSHSCLFLGAFLSFWLLRWLGYATLCSWQSTPSKCVIGSCLFGGHFYATWVREDCQIIF